MAQQILKEADGSFKSFFALLKSKKEGKYEAKVHIPKYLDKDSYYPLTVGFVRLKEDFFVLPYSVRFKKEHSLIKVKLPPILKNKAIKEIRIIPKANARFFEIQYTYEIELPEENKITTNKALAIDLGINNFATCVTNEGKTFIIDGRRLKSINQWFNKENARLQRIHSLQGCEGTSKKQASLSNNRLNAIEDYLNKSCKLITDYCLHNKIDTIVIGYNKDIQKNINIGKVNNQNFVNIPIGRFRNKLKAKCKTLGLRFVEVEESYTSKASFFDNDHIPVLSEKVEFAFSGKRIKRGLYKSSNGYKYNADVNGALNILKKSNVVCLTVLYASGVVDTPLRIRLN
jgi:IS605 OrfB family transposase